MKATNPTTSQPAPIVRHKRFTGTVVSSKMKDTIVVMIERFEKHEKYQKYLRLRKRFKVDDKGNTAGVGDKVIIEETRPISKEKHFKLAEIITRAQSGAEIIEPAVEVAE